MPDAPRVLVVEDEAPMRELVAAELSERGMAASGAADLAAARTLLGAREFDVVLLDMRLPDGEGTDLLREIRAEPEAPEVIVLTGHGTVSAAVEAMRLGAFHFAPKPFVLDEIELLVRRAAEKALLARRARALERIVSADPGEMVGDAPCMRELRSLLERVAAADSPVLVQGETGAGKELVARAVHARSPRARGPFVPVNCGALQEGLLESEVFGHERGSFTGAVRSREGLVEVAHGGTLFLDEIGEMPPALQVKLLRVLQDGEVRRVGSNRVHKVDVRFIAATNRDLGEAVREGRFREDLYYRIRVLPVTVPPLRERPADIPALAARFLARVRTGRPGSVEISPRAMEALKAYSWPGNVRELRNIVERMAVLAPAGTADLAQVPPEVRVPGSSTDGGGGGPGGEGYPADLSLEEVERRHVLRVLDACGGNKTRAAGVLGVTVRTLYNRLDAYRKGDESPRPGG